MGNTYRKVYLQCIFAVKNRDACLNKEWDEQVYKYISKILKEKGHFPLAINGHKDHVHLFFDYNGISSIPDLVKEIKTSTTSFIRDKFYRNYNFQWQEGYGIFSHGRDEKHKIIQYVMHQKQHHAKVSFRQEYISFLKAYELDYKEDYLFDFYF